MTKTTILKAKEIFKFPDSVNEKSGICKRLNLKVPISRLSLTGFKDYQTDIKIFLEVNYITRENDDLDLEDYKIKCKIVDNYKLAKEYTEKLRGNCKKIVDEGEKRLDVIVSKLKEIDFEISVDEINKIEAERIKEEQENQKILKDAKKELRYYKTN